MTPAVNVWAGLGGRARESHSRILSRGDAIGEWTLVEYKPGASGKPRVLPHLRCRCSCGAERWVNAQNLNRGASQSCGHVGGKTGRPPAADKVVKPS